MSPDAQDICERLIDAALARAAGGGWQSASLCVVAEEAGVSLVDAYAAFPTRLALLCGILSRTDRRVLEDGPADAEDSPRDRLFDIVMRRFDALATDREGVVAIIRALPGDPLTALQLAPGFAASLAWMLEAARLPATGLMGSLRVKGLGVVYLATLRTWLEDDSIDMAKTMAALDRHLQRADSLVNRLPAAIVRFDETASGAAVSFRSPSPPSDGDSPPSPAA